MEVSITIDKLTDCLIDTTTGEKVKTHYEPAVISASEAKQLIKDGWNFSWDKTQEEGYEVYKLFVEGSDQLQGMISFKADEKSLYVDVDVVESAPHNIGHSGQHIGVGGHLFAIACESSFNHGFDGFVAFTAKTNLIEYYETELGATQLVGSRMAIETPMAQYLVDKYLKEKEVSKDDY